jgi:glycosyltransferase involved in cell wall biosynthesis
MQSMDAPEITIIIPNYNNEQYLRDCLDSVLHQTFRKWECIVVNDGSTDNSLEIISGYAAKDPRFILVDQPNRGVCASRNTGMDMARGKYIAFLDADDCYTQWAMEVLHRAAVQNDADLVGGAAAMVPEDFSFSKSRAKNLKKKPRLRKTIILAGRGVEGFHRSMSLGQEFKWVWIWRQLFRKDLVRNKRFVESLYIGDDICFMMDVMHDIKKFVITSFIVNSHRLSNTSIMNSGNWGPRKFEHFPTTMNYIYQNVKDKYPGWFMDGVYQGLVRYLYEEVFINAMKAGKFQPQAAGVMRRLYGTPAMPKRYFGRLQRFVIWLFTRAYL